jgi:hypothetical protein
MTRSPPTLLWINPVPDRCVRLAGHENKTGTKYVSLFTSKGVMMVELIRDLFALSALGVFGRMVLLWADLIVPLG